MMSRNFLAFDIGGTNIKYGLLNHSGNLIKKEAIETPHDGLDSFLKTIKKIIRDNKNLFRGVCFSVPGTIDHTNEMIYGGGNLTFLDHQSFPELLDLDDSIPVTVENDGKAAALAELWLGNLKGVQNGAAITLGTGIGGGIIVNNKLVYGKHFQAGELSFMVDWKSFNEKDMLGTSGSAILMIKEIAEVLGLPNKKDGKAVFSAINASDSRIMPIFTNYCRTIAALINNVQMVIGGERFVIAGGISAQKILVNTIEKEYTNIREQIPILNSTIKEAEIMEARFHNDTNLYGALYHMLLENDN
ncbi:ROK family protein [Oenococcus oeni]|uniref:ROK family protein n=1 Tax=Oenococcus oeni TaxID=1247 RepID=UPI000AD47920